MPPRRRPKRRRYLWLFLPLLLIALPFGLYSWLQSDSGQAAVRTVNTLAAADGMGNRSLMEEGAEPVPQGPPAPRRLAEVVAALGSDFDGDVGIAVRSVEKGWVAAHKAERLYPQQSVSKLWVAMTLLDRVDAGYISLDDSVTLTQADLTIFHQPIRKRIGSGSYTTDIGDLFSLAMTRSDNTANDALFRRVGGQSGVQAFLAEQDIAGVRISPGEKLLQVAIAGMEWDDRYSTGRTFWQERDRLSKRKRARSLGAYLADPMDGATPMAITDALARLQRGELLSEPSSAYLIDLMTQSKTGPKRLRGGLAGEQAVGWTLPHKTGTGQDFEKLSTGYNDVGLLISPTGQHYALAVMIGATNRPVAERQELMQAVTRAVVQCEAEGWPGC